MIKRTVSTLFLWAVLVFAIYFFGGAGFAGLMLALSLLASFEACRLLEKCGLSPSYGVVALLSAAVYAPIFLNLGSGVFFGGAFLAVSLLAAGSLASPYCGFVQKRVIPTILAFIFIPLFLALLALVCGMGKSGLALAIWAVGSAKFCDVGGYIFGCAFGRHKIAPSVSPKKSVEGLLGGMALSAGFSLALTGLWKGAFDLGFNPGWLAALSAFALAPISLVSDLLESALKRVAGAKDSGNTIPGIGGALDLADSVLLCGPAAYFIAALILKM